MPTALNLLAFDGTEAASGAGTAGSYADGRWTFSTPGGNYLRTATGLDFAATDGMVVEAELVSVGGGNYQYAEIRNATTRTGLSFRLAAGQLQVMAVDNAGDVAPATSAVAANVAGVANRIRATIGTVGNPDAIDFEYSTNAGSSYAPMGSLSVERMDLGAVAELAAVSYLVSGSTSVKMITAGGGATVTGVTVTPSSATIAVGETEALAATVEGTGSPSQDVTWSSSDEAVATVASDGTVTAVAEGSCTITATSDADPDFSDTCAVTVVAAGGTTAQLAAVVKRRDGSTITGRAVRWVTTDPSVATVNGAGLVTAVGAGTCEVYPVAASGYRSVEGDRVTVTVT